MIRANGSLIILLVSTVAACSGTSSPVTTGSSEGGLAVGGNLGNGGALASGGATSTQAGTSSATGGLSGLGGTQGNTGGKQNTTGGYQTGTGGTQNNTGGTPNATGGLQNGNGGTQNVTGGTRTSTGGTQNSTGGTQTGTGGMQYGSGGTRNTGGTQSANGGTTASLHSSGTYASAGAWHGYIWPAIESGSAYDPNNHTTITPTAAQGFPLGGPPFCISGHVPATPNSLAVAMVGMNTNQLQTGGAVAAQWTATGTGILVNVTNTGGSPLRLQIQTNETGAIATLWCAMITVFNQDVIIPWSQFNTKCFSNNSGTYYDPLTYGISTVMVLVPGTSQAGGYDFNFCVNNMAPV